MPLPWKKAKSGRISRLVADLHQSPKHGGSLVVETGFPTSLIDLFVKNRDRLKRPSKRRQSSVSLAFSTPPPPPPPPPTRGSSFPASPAPLTPRRIREDPVERSEAVVSNKVEERVSGEITSIGYGGNGGAWVWTVVMLVVVVAVLALSTNKQTMGISLSALALLFMEFAAARVFTRLKLCPNARARLDSLLLKITGKKQRKEKAVAIDHIGVSSRGISETFQDSRDFAEDIRVHESNTNTGSWSEPGSVVIPEKKKPWVSAVESSEDSKRAKVSTEREVQTIRDLVFKNEPSKSSKLKSKIVKKIVPKKLRSSMEKKKTMKIKEEKEKEEKVVEVEVEVEGGGGGWSLTEVSSLVSDDKSEKIRSEISERDDDESNPPLLESFTEVEESQDGSSKANNSKTSVIALFVIVLVGLLGGKVLAIDLFLLWCLILRFADKYQVPQKPASQDVRQTFIPFCPPSFNL